MACLLKKTGGLPTLLGGLENWLLDLARNTYDLIEWPGVVALMAVESAAIPFPSEIIMPLAGWLLVKDRGLSEAWLLLAAFFGATGNTLGSVLAYYAGAWGGRPLINRFGRYILISRHDLDTADRWFAKYGTWAVLISRLLPVVRTFISVPAGIARMRIWEFIALTFVGSFLWSLGLAWAGFVLGENWERIRDWMRPADIPILVAVLVLVVWYVYRHVRRAWEEPKPSGPEV